jgi:hypothetical protein
MIDFLRLSLVNFTNGTPTINIFIPYTIILSLFEIEGKNDTESNVINCDERLIFNGKLL